MHQRIKYEESSPESKSDSDYGAHPPKLPKCTPDSGLLADQIKAHSMMKIKNAQGQPCDSLLPLKPVRKNCTWSDMVQPTPPVDMNSHNNEPSTGKDKSTESDTLGQGSKPTGNLSVSHDGLKKYKNISL